jgi:hypothetical protein
MNFLRDFQIKEEMGNTHKTKTDTEVPIVDDEIPKHGIVKEGILYSAYKQHIKPFDLIFFKGNDFASAIVAWAERKTLPDKSDFGYEIRNDEFTHCGIVVTSQILKHPLVEEGKLYIWESTTSGILAPDGIKNITGRSFYGSQLRDLDSVIDAYDFPDDTAIAVAHLLPEVFNPEHDLADTDMSVIPNLRDRFTSIFNKYDNVPYAVNPVRISASAFDCIRPARKCVENSPDDDDLEIFCSELVARVYIELGFLSSDVIPENIIPMDYFGFDAEKHKKERVPRIIQFPKAIVSRYHFLTSPLDLPQSVVTLDIDWFATGGNIPQRNPVSSKNFEKWNWQINDIEEDRSASE